MLDAIPVLNSEECELARQAVHALRSSWITRGSADYPFYTVGAASYIDAVPGTKRRAIRRFWSRPIRCCGSILTGCMRGS